MTGFLLDYSLGVLFRFVLFFALFRLLFVCLFGGFFATFFPVNTASLKVIYKSSLLVYFLKMALERSY